MDGKTQAVVYFLENGIDVNLRGTHQETALMYAASRGHLDTVKVLLARGADVNVRDETGLTALMAALSSRQSSAVPFELLDHGAEVNTVSREYHTALILAVGNGMPEVAKRLIVLGADVNATMADGTSVLQLAKRKGDQELIRLLKEAQTTKNK
jgi:ankyrin repeat protein